MKYRIWNKTSKEYEDRTTYVSINNVIMSLWVSDCHYKDLVQENYIVEESTGRFDSDNQEVYVGDIVEIDGSVGEIVFSSGQFTFAEEGGYSSLYQYINYDWTKIGTIHDKI